MKKIHKKRMSLMTLATIMSVASLALPIRYYNYSLNVEVKNQNTNTKILQNNHLTTSESKWENAKEGERKKINILAQDDLALEQALGINYLAIAKTILLPKASAINTNNSLYGQSGWEYDLADITRSKFGTFYDKDGNFITNPFDGREDVYVPVAARTMPEQIYVAPALSESDLQFVGPMFQQDRYRPTLIGFPGNGAPMYDKNNSWSYNAIRPNISFSAYPGANTNIEYSFDNLGEIQEVAFTKAIKITSSFSYQAFMVKLPVKQGAAWNWEGLTVDTRNDVEDQYKTPYGNDLFPFRMNIPVSLSDPDFYYKTFNFNAESEKDAVVGVRVAYTFADFLNATQSKTEKLTTKRSLSPYISASLVDGTTLMDGDKIPTDHKSADYEVYAKNPIQYTQISSRLSQFGRTQRVNSVNPWLNVDIAGLSFSPFFVSHYWEWDQYTDINSRYLNRKIPENSLLISNPGDVLFNRDQYDFSPWNFFDNVWKPIATNLNDMYPQFANDSNYDQIQYDMEVDVSKPELVRVAKFSNEKLISNRLKAFSWLYNDVQLGSKQNTTFSSTFDSNGKLVMSTETASIFLKQPSKDVEIFPSYTSLRYDENGNVKKFYLLTYDKNYITYSGGTGTQTPSVHNIWTAMLGDDGQYINDYVLSINMVLSVITNILVTAGFFFK